MLFTCLQSDTEGFIVSIGHPRETVGITDLEVVSEGVCRVTFTNDQERKAESSAFGVSGNLHVSEMGIIDITFILESEDVVEEEGTKGIHHGYYFVDL